jgi:hypothetical protein
MIEAMACGTPVIAFNCGSVPEVMDDGLTGFIVNSEDAAVAAIDRLDELDRAKVRQQFERRFTARRMAQDYVDVYTELCQPVVACVLLPDPAWADARCGRAPAGRAGRHETEQATPRV